MSFSIIQWRTLLFRRISRQKCKCRRKFERKKEKQFFSAVKIVSVFYVFGWCLKLPKSISHFRPNNFYSCGGWVVIIVASLSGNVFSKKKNGKLKPSKLLNKPRIFKAKCYIRNIKTVVSHHQRNHWVFSYKLKGPSKPTRLFSNGFSLLSSKLFWLIALAQTLWCGFRVGYLKRKTKMFNVHSPPPFWSNSKIGVCDNENLDN